MQSGWSPCSTNVVLKGAANDGDLFFELAQINLLGSSECLDLGMILIQSGIEHLRFLRDGFLEHGQDLESSRILDAESGQHPREVFTFERLDLLELGSEGCDLCLCLFDLAFLLKHHCV